MSRRRAPRVELARRGRVATLTMAAPDKGNRIDAPVAQELRAAAEEIAGDDSVAVVLLRSRGRDFCLGAEADHGVDWASPLAAVPQPLVAAIQGDAVDEGAELALLADIRVCARSARFRFGHLEARRLPRHGATQRLPRAVGRMRAMEMLLSGRWVAAAEAARIGLATAVVPATALRAAAAAAVRDLAAKGPLALRYAKEAIAAGSDMTLAQGIRLEQDLYVLLQTTQDRAEGVRSFLRKRPPRFRGR